MEFSSYTTVFRSAEHSADEEAQAARDLLLENGIDAIVLDDSAPGVVDGTWEVRVPYADVTRAEALLARNQEVTEAEGDTSHEFDLVPIFESRNAAARMEALAIQNVLEAAGIEAVVVGTSTLPAIPYVVQVARARVDDARRVIAEATAAGPAAAEAAEAESERQ